MKKLFFAATLLMFGISANAQWEEEDIFATGTISYVGSDASVSGLNINQSGFSIGLKGGYFIQDEIAVGITLGYADVSQGSDSLALGQNFGMTQYGAFGRYYMPYNDKFSAFGELGINMASGGGEQSIAGTTADISMFNLFAGVTVGMNYMFTDNMYLELTMGTIGYQSTTMTQTVQDVEQSISSGAFVAALDLTSVNMGFGLMF